MPASLVAPAQANHRLRFALVLGGLVALTFATYANTLGVPFLFDDIPSIVDNPSIRSWTDWKGILSPPVGEGLTVAGRPIVNASLALNYAWGGLNPVGYHLVNLAIHLVNGVLLYCLVQSTLERQCAEKPAPVGWKLKHPPAEPFAAAVAAIWLLHPLAGTAVTYVVQRAESLATLFMLLALWAFARSTEATRAGRWAGLAWLAGLSGVLTKETAAVVPLLALLYDRTFLAGGFSAALRLRWKTHALLASNWIVLGGLVAAAGGRGGTAGFACDISVWHYLLTQAEAIWLYLSRVVWPHPLVFDHGVPVQTDWIDAAPALGGLLLVLGLTAWAVARRRVAGFLAASFFLLLAPSSSFVPVASQTIAEHRMYLPLAAPLTMIAWSAWSWLGRFAWAGIATAAVALALVSFQRNLDYASEKTIWAHTVQVRPDNPRAHNGLGVALQRSGDEARALIHFREAVRLRADYSEAHNNLGQLLHRQGRHTEALPHLESAVASKPRALAPRLNLAATLVALDRPDAAESHYLQALTVTPASALPRLHYGNHLLQRGRWNEAAAQLAAAARLDPYLVDARANLGQVLLQLGRPQEALAALNEWLQLEPSSGEARLHCASALLRLGRANDALAQLGEALAIQPQFIEARIARARLLLDQGAVAAASEELRTAVAQQPGHAEARRLLAEIQEAGSAAPGSPFQNSASASTALGLLQQGTAQLRANDVATAIATFRQALQLDPDSAAGHHNLALALVRDRRPAEALPHYERFLQAAPNSAVGHFNYALALHLLGRTPEARAATQRALALRPDFPEAQALLRRLGGGSSA